MIEPLESRVAPATLTGKVLTYMDVDGDNVIITFKTKAAPTEANFTFNNAFATAGPQQLQLIDLSGDAKNDGASITVKVEQAGAGDGKANIGAINAAGRDLGVVTIPGDLGQIDCGDDKPDPGLVKLSVDSLGRLGVSTQGAGGSISSLINGPLKTLLVAGNLAGDLRALQINKPAGVIGKAIIGGDLDGVSQGEGSISAEGDFGTLIIKGKILGGAAADSGTINADNKLGKLIVGVAPGKGAPLPVDVVISGNGQSSASIDADRIGSVIVYGSIQGGGNDSAHINAGGSSIAKLIVTGNIVGGAGANSAFIEADSVIRSATIGGDLQGGSGLSSGVLEGVDGLGKVVIHGSLKGGSNSDAGIIEADGPFKSLTIDGSVIGGSGNRSGAIFGSLSKALIKGDVMSGTGARSAHIISDSFLGRITVLGDVVGTAAHNVVFIARSAAKPGKTDVAIKNVKIGGDASFLDILAGYNGSALTDIQALADGNAGIGAVNITGNVTGVNIAAGVDPVDGKFGNGNDVVPGTFAAPPIATIGKIVVGGAVNETAAAGDSFAFTAQLIKSATIGGTKQALTKGKDNLPLAADTSLIEVA